MKKIVIKQQPKLGFLRIFILTIIGIRYRFFRSIVTLVVVGVAIAFIMNVVSEGVLKTAIVHKTKERIQEKRIFAEWVARLSMPGTPEQILRELASAKKNDSVYRQTMFFGKLSEKEMLSFYTNAKKAVLYLDFFRKLRYAYRKKLVHNTVDTRVFAHLSDHAEMDEFVRLLETSEKIHFITSISEFRAFIRKWHTVRKQTDRVAYGWSKAISEISESLGQRSVVEALEFADGDFGDVIRKSGFMLDRQTAEIAAFQAKQINYKGILESCITYPEIRRAIASRLNMLPSEVTIHELRKLISNRKTAAWLIERLSENNIEIGGLTPERMVALAMAKKEDADLFRAERIVAGTGKGFFGVGERMGWLTIISMVLCVVGIANITLMSVTERFREIATLKCVGALDSFIMLSVMIEAFLLGAVGGIGGSILGTVIGFVRMLITFRYLLLSAIPFGKLTEWMLVSVAIGISLSVVASIYPSLKAARLAPMEAMRIE